MTRKDKDALRRALVAARALDAQTAQAVETNLKTSTWQEAAEYAAYHCQMRVLKLRPWQTPPMISHDEIDPEGRYGGTEQEVGLRRKMLALRVSIFEPDPLAAIERAEAEAAAPAA
jgi:hypothetical protein